MKNKSLNVTSTNATRPAGILLSPGLFTEAGTYTLSFDVTAYSGAVNNSGLVSIWSGNGYDPTLATGNALILDTLSAELKTMGTTTSALLGSTSITATATGSEISFTYDGTSAVALFFGGGTNSWPFPTVTYDNISISQPSIVPVPEPSGSAFLALVDSASCLIRRRRP